MLINLSLMKGEVPRLETHLLSDDAATLARDCVFSSGIVAPIKASADAGITLNTTPKSLFLYQGQHWFSFYDKVSVIDNPMAQDQWQRAYWTGQGKPKLTAQDIATGSGAQPAAWYDLGVPRPSVPPIVIHIDSSTGEPPEDGELPEYDDEDRLYIQTYLTRFGEEGAPGDPSASVLIEKPGSTVTVKLAQPGVNTHNITHTRLYRSATSSGEGDYLMVAELPISQDQYVDSARDANGASLETWDYDTPDEHMQGLCSMANGIVCGFAGNEVMFSESYLPYAWPEDYRGTTDDEIVAMISIEASLVIVTKGKPYLYSGVMPSSMTGTRLNVEQACVSAQSLVVINGVAFYASPDGIVQVSSSGASVVTEPIMTRDQWQEYMPATVQAWSVEGKYVAQSSVGAFIFDPSTLSFTQISESWGAAHNDLASDTLYVSKGDQLFKWRRSESVMDLEWQSKDFLVPVGSALGCARIQSPEPEKLAVEFIVDGEVAYSLAVGEIDDQPFRLPPIRGMKWKVKVSGTSKVERILIASSMQELG